MTRVSSLSQMSKSPNLSDAWSNTCHPVLEPELDPHAEVVGVENTRDGRSASALPRSRNYGARVTRICQSLQRPISSGGRLPGERGGYFSDPQPLRWKQVPRFDFYVTRTVLCVPGSGRERPANCESHR